MDDDCPPVEIDYWVIQYEPAVCVNPIQDFLIIEPGNNHVTNEQILRLTGLVQPLNHVDKIQVRVNGGPWIDVFHVDTLWNDFVDLVEGTNYIEARVIPDDDLCPILYDSISVTYIPAPVCEEPLTELTIAHYTPGMVITTEFITLTGTVTPGHAVNSVFYSVNG